MPGLVRKLLIFAAVDGLILQPAPPRNHPPATQQAIKVDYKGNVGPLLKDRRDEDTTAVSVEAYGIIGRSLQSLRKIILTRVKGFSKLRLHIFSSLFVVVNRLPKYVASPSTKSPT